MIEGFTPHSASTCSPDSSLVQRNREAIMKALSSAPLAVDGAMPSSAAGAVLFEKPLVVTSVAVSEKSPGRKYDGGKAPLSQGFLLYFGRAVRGVANISAYGAKKYEVQFSDQNWRKVDNAKGRYADALLRHLEAHLRGEVNDPESGLPHVDHMAWNALALSELEKSDD